MFDEAVANAAVKPSDILRKMADLMDRNADQPFGGAFVVIPPENGGEVLEMLVLDNKRDAAQFWSTLKTKCEIQVTELDEQHSQRQPFGRR